MNVFTIYFDGAVQPRNPGGVGAYGYTIQHGETFIERNGKIGQWSDLTNNFAEFFALYKALEHVSNIVKKPGHVEIKGDSLLVIKIMGKKWKANRGKEYYKAYSECSKIVQRLRREGISVSYSWIPREKNEICDRLSKSNY